MYKDVLIVDDELDWIDLISEIVEYYSHNPIGFSNFYDVINFIKKRDEAFYACFIDMKPLRFFNKQYLKKEEKELLETPEKIYNIIKSKNWDKNFYFMSSHKSEHDEKVLERTNAKFIEKSDLSKKLEEILK